MGEEESEQEGKEWVEKGSGWRWVRSGRETIRGVGDGWRRVKGEKRHEVVSTKYTDTRLLCV